MNIFMAFFTFNDFFKHKLMNSMLLQVVDTNRQSMQAVKIKKNIKKEGVPNTPVQTK